MIPISDINDVRITDYKSLKGTPSAHSLKNIFIAETENIVLKLLKSNSEVLSVFAIPSFYEHHHDLISKLKINYNQLFVAEKSLMKSIIGFNHHTGILAIAKKPLFSTISDLKPPYVILNGIVNSENVGSIVRNCLAFGIRSMIFDHQASDPYLRRAVRVSMGAVFAIKFYKSSKLNDDIIYLRKNKTKIIAAELTNNSLSIFKKELNKNTAIIFGNEGKGISNEILEICDYIVHIPINKKADSLNVASSSAIILNYLHQNI